MAKYRNSGSASAKRRAAGKEGGQERAGRSRINRSVAIAARRLGRLPVLIRFLQPFKICGFQNGNVRKAGEEKPR
jgi:hypothetical protein